MQCHSFPELPELINRLKDKVMKFFNNFLKNEQGQDLIEYTLLLAFVALAAAALFTNVGTSVSGIWGTASTQVSNAATAAS
jgi:Flp pilus assembly pilin Flp